jgi:hypothetical protein
MNPEPGLDAVEAAEAVLVPTQDGLEVGAALEGVGVQAFEVVAGVGGVPGNGVIGVPADDVVAVVGGVLRDGPGLVGDAGVLLVGGTAQGNCLAGLFTTCTLFRTFLVAEKCLVFRRC